MAAKDAETQRLEQLYIELASLAGGLAHEIKNPLSTIQMNLQLLEEDFPPGDTPAHKRAAKRIHTTRAECQRLSDVLDDFLRYAHASKLETQPASLNALVEQMIEFGQPRIEAAGLVLRADLQRDLPPVNLDGDLFRQALLNLLLNAEAMLKPGDEIILRTRSEGADVVLDVIDTGPGMTAPVREKIFQPFFSTRRGGTGLGLPTTRRIVESHGGRITVDSEPGKGSAFHIFLPASQVQP